MPLKAGDYVRAKWRGIVLSWYWSGKYWYCVQEHKSGGPTGSGNTKDEAFEDYKRQLDSDLKAD